MKSSGSVVKVNDYVVVSGILGWRFGRRFRSLERRRLCGKEGGVGGR